MSIPTRVLFAILFVLIISTTALAQGDFPPMLPASPTQAPIDGGLGLLAAAGGIYAYKKLRQKKH